MPTHDRIRRFLVGFSAGVLAGVLLLTGWFAVTGVAVGLSAADLRSTAAEVESAVAAGDYSGASDLLGQAQDQASALNRRLNSAPWSWAQSFPAVGPTVAAGASLVGATDSVLAATEGLRSGLSEAWATDVASMAPALAGLAPDLTATGATAAEAHKQVAAIDPDAVLGPAQGGLGRARAQLLRTTDSLAQGAQVAQVLPGMLGFEEPVRWLVLLGQPAEARGSGGGFYGAYLSLSVSEGRFTLIEAAANGPETAVRQDLSSLPAEYRRLWGSDATYLWGYNLTRHYPYPASVIQRVLDPAADYVVALDPRAVAGLVALSGPVTAHGVALDATNAEAFFARDIYEQYPDSVMKDRVMLAFLEAVFAKLGASSLEPAKLWGALGPAVGGGHLQVWSPDAAVEALLEPSILGGAVPARSGPWVTAAFNNTAGNKIDSFVGTSLSYEAAGDCATGVVAGTLAARLTIDPLPPGLPRYISGRNDAPSAPYGTSSMYVHLYGPSGAVARTFTVNGAPVSTIQGSERGHPVWGAKVQLAPGQPVEVRVDFDQPAFPAQPLTAAAQPMVQDTAVRVVDGRSCAVR